MAIDPRLLGNLKEVPPLSAEERRRLYETMQTDRDRRRFESIVSRSAKMLSPQPSVGGAVEAYQAIVWEFGNEVVNRLEARDLRKLAEQVRQRDRSRGQDRLRTR